MSRTGQNFSVGAGTNVLAGALSFFRNRLSRQRLALGEARRLSSDVILSFRGHGPAQFRVQHTSDHHGKPYEFGWCDVSVMSDARFDPRSVVHEHIVRGLFVDRINGDRDALYRHYKAAWLRVIPFDDSKEALRACKAYAISLRPA